MTQQDYDTKLTEQQREAMHNLQERSGIPWEEFLAKAHAPSGKIFDYVGIPNFHGMYVGIEADGYTHS